PRYTVRNWQRLVSLSIAAGRDSPTHIIWPEAAPPFPLEGVPAALSDIAQLTARGAILLTGNVRIERNGGAPHFYNSFAMFGPGGKLLATSDKFHLVPFGEYLPFESTLRAIGITEIAANTGFSSG